MSAVVVKALAPKEPALTTQLIEAAHRVRMAQIEAEGEAECARITARIDAATAALDKLVMLKRLRSALQ